MYFERIKEKAPFLKAPSWLFKTEKPGIKRALRRDSLYKKGVFGWKSGSI